MIRVTVGRHIVAEGRVREMRLVHRDAVVFGDDDHSLIHTEDCIADEEVIIGATVVFCRRLIDHTVQQPGAARQIQAGQLVAVAVELQEGSLHAQVQGLELVAVAINKGQQRRAAEIQALKLVFIALQMLQLRLSAEIQGGQLISVAVQLHQLGIGAEIQRGQTALAAVQYLEGRVAA